MAGQTLPFGATYLPVFSHAASRNWSKHAARGDPHLTTQAWALPLQLSALASVTGIKNRGKNGDSREDAFHGYLPAGFVADCSRQDRQQFAGRNVKRGQRPEP
jgi:hypothetical protein